MTTPDGDQMQKISLEMRRKTGARKRYFHMAWDEIARVSEPVAARTIHE